MIATLDGESVYKDADIVVVAIPTNYDLERNHFETSYVGAVIGLVTKVNKNVLIVIKSTITVGYTKSIREKFNFKNIIFHLSFLEKGKLYKITYILQYA